MTNQQHPITPPPELVEQWWDAVQGTFTHLADEMQLATAAAQWGADQELEACYYWIENYHGTDAADSLQHGRRPKPPSETDQALEELENMVKAAKDFGFGGTDPTAIRRALERLKKMEQLND